MTTQTINRSALAAALVIAAGCSFGASGYGEPINGLRCDATAQEPVRVRVAVHLVSGPVPEPVTMGVGSTGSCNYPVRTEDEDGIVIVRGDEAAGTATLDDFLTIWEYAIPAGSGGAAEFRAAATDGEIRVNGEAVPGPADTVILRDGDVIDLVAP